MSIIIYYLNIHRYVYENFIKDKWGWSEIDKYWDKRGAENYYVTIRTNLGSQDDAKVKKLLKESTSYNTVNPDEVILQPTLDNKPVRKSSNTLIFSFSAQEIKFLLE
jgi:hypothetical protein